MVCTSSVNDISGFETKTLDDETTVRYSVSYSNTVRTYAYIIREITPTVLE